MIDSVRRPNILAIALHQPHATLIGVGAKLFETRHWPPPAWAIGIPIALHAAKRKVPQQELMDMILEIGDVKRSGDAAMRARCEKAMAIMNKPEALPYGALIGIMTIGKPIAAETVRNDPFGYFSEGRFAWPVTSFEWLPSPVPTVGRQKWWSVADPRS